MTDRMRATLALPWAREPGDRLRFGVILTLLLLVFIPPAVVIPFIELPDPVRDEPEEVPPQLAELLPEPAPEPMPAPEPIPEPEPEPEPTPEPEPAPAPPPEPAEVPAPVEEPAPAAPPPESVAETTREARDVASRSGLLAMKDQLAAMRSLASSSAPSTVRTLSAEARDKAESGAERVVGEEIYATSGGIEDEATPQERIRLAAHQTQDLAAPRPATPKTEPPAREQGPAQRSMAKIRAVFDRNQPALYSLYSRALRKKPGLAGTVLLKLVIEPDGRVSSAEIISSELGDEALESKILARVQLFDFGAADVAQRTVEFPVAFLPPG